MMGQTGKKPGVLAWIGLLKAKKKLEKSKLVSFQIAGVQYGNMYCGITDEFSDQLQMYSGLLDELGYKWQNIVSDEVSRCDQLVRTVEKLAYKLQRAMGGDGETAVQRAQEQCYYRLDVPFRQWLLTIDPDIKLKEQRELRSVWRSQAKKIALDLGYELVKQGGTVALVGRKVKEKRGKKEEYHYYCAPKAFNQFLYELKQWESETG